MVPFCTAKLYTINDSVREIFMQVQNASDRVNAYNNKRVSLGFRGMLTRDLVNPLVQGQR